ncbi:MAG TPA: hypothetical protein VGK67_18040 [Myxococcales bacterium]|jgi:hypothetical protein
MSRAAPLLFVLFLAVGCLNGEVNQSPGDVGVPGGGIGGGGGPTVVIQSYTFIPVELFVSPGDTISFTNLDGDAHTVTSQAHPNDYMLGEVNGISFDLPAFTGTRTFKIPENAQRGTVIYYFDRVYTTRMNNQPRITIQ